MDTYVDMGYGEEEAREAVERFGDDLHAGCHWLMMQKDLGRIPRRLKRRKTEDANHTYIGSRVQLDETTWVVVDFDPDHALIRLSSTFHITRRDQWVHMSDARIHWQSVKHDDMKDTVPKTTWTMCVGHMDLDLDMLTKAHKNTLTKENAINIMIREGRPLGFGVQWKMWRTMIALSKECIHVPSREKPLLPSGENIHLFRCERLSYLTALCDVYKIHTETFSEKLFAQSAQKTAEMFPEHIQKKVKTEIMKWKSPQRYMRHLYNKWKKDCLPMVIVKCEDIFPTFVRCSVHFHDMTFVRPKQYNSGIHLHFQRLFQIIFPFMRTNDTIHYTTLHQQYLEHVLTSSKKLWQASVQPHEDFVTKLYSYQEKCLSWLIHRETDAIKTSDWGWHSMRPAPDSSFQFFASVFGHVSLTRPSKGIRGGLLAQEMGMGKTIELLALMATNNVKSSGPTLVVVPTTMLSVWQSEAKKHTPSFKVLKFHGPRRTTCMQDLREADIILTTYRIVVLESQKHTPTLTSIRFGRIVLDESHELRDLYSATTKAVCRLKAPLRWCVSATPWPKAMHSVSSMLAFLGVEPFAESRLTTPPYHVFSAAQMLIRNYDSSTPVLIKNVLEQCTWYQKKSHVSLQLPTLQYQDIELDHDNMDVYEHLKDVIKTRMEMDVEMSHRNLRTRMMHYTRWLRLAASHIDFNQTFCYGVPDTSVRAHTQVKTMEEFMKTLGSGQYDQNLKQTIESWAEGQETCAICMDVMDRPTLTPCHHMFCFECIQSSYQHDTQRKCPLCRVSAGSASLQELVRHDTESTLSSDSEWTIVPNIAGKPVKVHTKIYNILTNTVPKETAKFRKVVEMVQKGEEKIIIFTQFHNVWKRMCQVFKDHDISFSCIEGRMTNKKRDTAIQSFQQDPKVRAFVMTTKTAGVGITLTAGSHVVFMEPCEDVSLSKQAVGRAWRIGQTRPVTVSTLRSKGTMDMFSSRELEEHLNVTTSQTNPVSV